MCIVFWASAPSPPSPSALPPAYRFILAANRDEYLERPTADMAWHDFAPGPSSSTAPSTAELPAGQGVQRMSENAGKGPYLCGRDLGDPARGTWLGMARNGQLGVLTNVHVEMGKDEAPEEAQVPARGPQDGSVQVAASLPHPTTTPGASRASSPARDARHRTETPSVAAAKKPLSRGALIRDYLVGSMDAARDAASSGTEAESHEERFCRRMREDKTAKYNPFNLLLFDLRGAATPGSTAAPEPAGWYYSNAAGSDRDGRDLAFRLGSEQMSSGGLSNTPLDAPWPKVKEGTAGMGRLVEEMRLFEPVGGDEREGRDEVIEALMGFMGQSKPVRHRSDLPTTICVPLCEIPLPAHHATPAHLAHGPHAISSATPARPDTPTHSAAVKYDAAERPYGTRLTTLVLVRGDGEVVVVERDRLRIAQCGGEDKVVLGGKPDRVFRFRVEG